MGLRLVLRNQKVAITGSNGFIGKPLTARCLASGAHVVGVLRQPSKQIDLKGITLKYVGEIGPDTDWEEALNGVEAVVHLAGISDASKKIASVQKIHQVNALGTEHLARCAAHSGVRRFVFLSSIKVHGETCETPIRETDPIGPCSEYAASKLKAETAIWRICNTTGMEAVILRPALVYGPGVKGGFLKLMSWIAKGMPLPLGAIRNRRSILFLDNLIDGIMNTLTHAGAAGKTFFGCETRILTSHARIDSDVVQLACGQNPAVFHPRVSAPDALLGQRAEKRISEPCRIALGGHITNPRRDRVEARRFGRNRYSKNRLLVPRKRCPRMKVTGSCVLHIPRKLKNVFFDLLFSSLAIFPATLLGIVIATIIRTTSKGPVLHWSRRIGRDNTLFLMPKFRTMHPDTPAVATHLLENPERWITPVGKLLRKFSLDELPQLYSVLTGDMRLVGPRPALFNQDDLIALRTQKGIHRLKPGITGWAQVNGRDDLPIPVKVRFDEEYLKKRSLRFDLKILLLTVIGCLKGKGVAH